MTTSGGRTTHLTKASRPITSFACALGRDAMLVEVVLLAAVLATFALLSKRSTGIVSWHSRAIRRIVRVPSGTVFTTLNYPSRTTAAPVHVVIVPGNPGVVEFYERFSAVLHEELGHGVHVTVVSHAGHARGRHNNKRVFDFQDQVRHKQEFLRALMDGTLQVLHSSSNHDTLADVRAHTPRPEATGSQPGSTADPIQAPVPQFVLMGHSIGAYMCTQLMCTLPEHSVAQAHLLTPTLLHIGSTPNGRRLTPVFRYLRWAAALLAGALSLMPSFLRRWLLSWNVGTDACALDGMEELCCPHVVRNSLWMALHEMEQLRDLDDRPLRQHAHKIRGLFAHGDQWVPPEHRELLTSRFADIDWQLAQDARVKHAFVLTGPDQVARQCAQWVAQLDGVLHTPRSRVD